MCGIAGIFQPALSAEPNRELLARMTDALTHRGPDERGIHIEASVGLGHRRLSIIDLATGQQPLFNEDHSVVVVYNGEIYNFQELAKELSQAGHQFRTHSDTEVIVHAWEEWGQDCVTRFRGMFAFAIWDRNRRTLFIARDRLGIKPLYYAWLPNDQLIFASELKALTQHPDLPRQIDPQAVEDFFAYGYVPEPKSIFAAVRKLEPGHHLTLHSATRRLPDAVGYWDFPFEQNYTGTLEAAQDELIERIKEAVQIRLVAEVPLGAFLSGGVDSSAVVATMAGLDAKPVKTCTIAFSDPKFNEADFAAQVAKRYQTDHQVDQVEADDFALLDKLTGLYDEPFADSSALPTYRVCEAARKRVTVALSGDGGDENIAGYRRYRFHLYEEKLRSRVPQGLRSALFAPLSQIYPKADWAPQFLRAKSTFQSLARDSVSAYFHSVSRMTDEQRGKLYSSALQRELQNYSALEVFRQHAANSPTQDPLSLVQYLDLKTFLVAILHKVDRASMAHSLEVRVPLLDHVLVEWLSSLPPDFKLRGQEGKYVFKKALEPILPNDILYRPKQGFSIPLARWFRGPLRDQLRTTLMGDELADSGLFNPDYVKKLIEEHQRGQRDHSTVLWELLVYASFYKQNLL